MADILTQSEIKRLGKLVSLYMPLAKSHQSFHQSQAEVKWIFGGNQCLGGEQLIYDPVKKVARRISDINEPFHVYAYNGREMVVAEADTPFIKAPQQLYELKLSNGKSIICSANHLILDASCEWRRISELQVESSLFQPPSILGSDFLIPCEDARHYFETVQGSRYDCLGRFYSDDEQLRNVLSIAPNAIPLSIDAQEHKEPVSLHGDVLGSKYKYNRLCQLFVHPSNLGVLHRNAVRFFDILYYAFCRLYKSALHQPRVCLRSTPEFCLQQSTGGLTRLDNSNISAFCHDYEAAFFDSYNSPKINNNGSIAVISLDVKRFDDIWDFNVPIYHNYLAGGIVHHNSGKTYTNMMDLALLCLDVHPFHKVSKGVHWACIESWEQVRDILWKEYLEKFIPAHHIANIQYGQDKTPKKIFLKTGHLIEFKAFNQGRELFQGREIDSCYCDEQCHHDFQGIFNEIQARLLAKQGFLSWSMTPIIPQIYLEERIERMFDTDEVFHADLNENRISRGGYISDKRIDDMINEWPEEVQATRIRGEFASFYGAVFKTFNRNTHVIKPFDIPKSWRRYRGIDFGFTNPFVCLWLAKDKDENWYVYREYYQAKTGIDEHIVNVKRHSGREKYIETWADPEEAEDRDELRKAGIPTKKARNAIARGIEVVQRKFKVKPNGKPSLFIFNTCRNTCREIPFYRYPEGSSSKNPADVPVQKNDHTIDALRYVIYSTERPIKKGRVYAA